MKGRLNLSVHRHLQTSEKGSYLESDRTVIAISTKKQSVRNKTSSVCQNEDLEVNQMPS